jgi:hypothetical protein
MDEKYYLSISFDSITVEEAESIIKDIIDRRGTLLGMSVTYQEAI